MALGPGLTCRNAAGLTPSGDRWWTLELSADRDFSWEIVAPLPGEPAEIDAGGPQSFTGGVFECRLSGASAAVRARWDGTAART